MAEGVVPFGHDGFQTRVQKIPFHQSAACENVAFSSSYGEALPKVFYFLNFCISSFIIRKL